MNGLLTIDDPAYFDRLAEIESAHWWSLGLWRLERYWLESALRGRSGLLALDVGGGTGLTAARLARLPGIARVIGVEPSPAALTRARQHLSSWVRATALSLPFEDGAFDLITCLDVLQHLPEGGDRDGARELFRVLRPGGVALIRANARGFTRPRARSGPVYRLDELADVIAGAGFRIRRASYANCLPALAQEMRGTLRVGRGSAGGHPAGGGLQIRMPPRWHNRLMGLVATAEAFAAGRLGLRLLFGHSTLVLAEKG